MKIQISKKLSWIICGLGWMMAIISIFFLPDTILQDRDIFILKLKEIRSADAYHKHMERS